jgi:predicted RNA-binding protein YlqC (UPF0109 family)
LTRNWNALTTLLAMNNSLHHPISKIVFPLVEGICKYPEQLEIKERNGTEPNSITIVLYPHMADYPKLCGMDGRQIKALRFLVKRMGEKMSIGAELDLKESWNGDRENKTPFEHNPNFDKTAAIELITMFEMAIWPDSFNDRTVKTRQEGDKWHIYLTATKEEDQSLIVALADVFYPYGYRNGCKIVIHAGPENSEHCTIRKSPVPSGERER